MQIVVSYFRFFAISCCVVCGLFCWAILRLMDYVVILGKNVLDMKKFRFIFVLTELLSNLTLTKAGLIFMKS